MLIIRSPPRVDLSFLTAVYAIMGSLHSFVPIVPIDRAIKDNAQKY